MYYEIKGNGHIRQQIFCRGTTLAVEIMTCLSFWMVYDEDLDCRIHSGFRDHADHLLKDILPLLPPAEDKRTTLEVSGHSLGGAVAFILAAKLRKKGFNVVRATSVGAPRFCATEIGAQTIQALLPKNTLRIENDTDIITYLPPFGKNVGDKLYMLDSSRDVAFIPKNDATKWSDSVFVNFSLHEQLRAGGVPHRVYTYVARFEEAFGKSEIANQEETNHLDTSVEAES
jgi:pimeloyl-ACP methyl ester carboxylesterase